MQLDFSVSHSFDSIITNTVANLFRDIQYTAG